MKKRTVHALSLLLVALTLGIASPAWADILLPEQEACMDTMKGADCSYEGKSGICAESMCCRATPDGQECSGCLSCETEASGDPDMGGTDMGGTDEGSDPDRTEEEDEGLCSVSDLQGGAVPASTALLGLLLLIGLRRKS